MRLRKSLKGLVLSLVMCCIMSVTAFASEIPLSASIQESSKQVLEMQESENMELTPNGTLAQEVAPILTEDELDANRKIYRNNSLSGRFNGRYSYTFTNTDTVYLDVYMPNYSGTDYLQGTISLVGNDGSRASVKIANYSGESWTITFTGIRTGVNYHFNYELYSVGSSMVGYIVSAARVN